jgi:Xaa-Pro aminopeptidase
MGPRDRELEAGDILIIDTGTVYDGYFCDFDRNFAFGRASDTARRVYETVYRSTDAGLAAARPGATTTDVWQAMWSVLEAGGAKSNDVGRMGHGLGAQLTEWPSLTSKDQTPLEPGMVITLEPGMNYGDGKIMVHEENIVITDSGAQLLSRRAAPELPIIN